MTRYLTLLAALLWVYAALPAAAQTFREGRLIRCDNSGSLPGQGDGTSPLSYHEGGVTCETGDFSEPFDARGFTEVCVFFHEYNITGSAEAKLWNCVDVGDPQEHPGGTPVSSDPEPLCTDITETIFAGGGGPLDGVTMSGSCLSNFPMSYLVGEIQACTGDCDSTLMVRVSR